MGKNRTIRTRVNGILVRDQSLLLIKLRSPVSDSDVWMPPGGGVEFGEQMSDAVERELLEETGIQVKTGKLRYIHEVISPRIHAIEFYFDCKYISGTVELGSDPELPGNKQILKEASFVPFREFDNYPIVPKILKDHLISDINNDYNAVREAKTVY